MADKIKILWVSSHPPYSTIGHAGGQTFNYYFKKFYDDGAFEIRLICISYPEEVAKTRIEYPELECLIYPVKRRTNRASIDRLINIESKYNPLNRNVNLISNIGANAIISGLRETQKKGFVPDVVICEWTNTLVLLNHVKRLFPRALYVASEHDVNYVGLERRMLKASGKPAKIYETIRYLHGKKTELKCLKKCDLILPHNKDNRSLLIKDGIDGSKIEWLTPYFHNMSGIQHTGKHNILFYGAMSRPENYLSAEWFIDNVLPRLLDLNVRFVIVGSNPPQRLIDRTNERVIVTGFVDKVELFFEDAFCFVAPLLLGAGIKVKIIEALSSGIPVLTNEIGIEGINVNDGEEYFLCHEAEEYEVIIRKLYNNQIDVNKMALNAMNFVNRDFSYAESYKRYKTKLMTLLGVKY